MFGFKGKGCLKAAADIAKELERLGVVTDIGAISMKEEADPITETQHAMKVERG
jgi:virulence-associated protein VapD